MVTKWRCLCPGRRWSRACRGRSGSGSGTTPSWSSSRRRSGTSPSPAHSRWVHQRRDWGEETKFRSCSGSGSGLNRFFCHKLNKQDPTVSCDESIKLRSQISFRTPIHTNTPHYIHPFVRGVLTFPYFQFHGLLNFPWNAWAENVSLKTRICKINIKGCFINVSVSSLSFTN